MESYPQHFDTPADHSVGDYWTNKPSAWSGTSPAYDQQRDSQSQPPVYSQYPNQGHDEDSYPEEQVPRHGDSGAIAVSGLDEDIRPEIPNKPAAAYEAKDKEGLEDYPREEIELQLATIIEYIRNKKLRPILWACCSCGKEQKYREHLDPEDRLRCQYPRCGVSDRGFRIYRVHDMCQGCTVFVDRRAPVTKKGLKKKRDEVREVLKKIKKVYEDVDALLEFDDKEAEKTAVFSQEREAREELDREKKEEQDMHRIEKDRLRRDGWIAEDGYGDDLRSDSEDEEREREDEYESEQEEARVPTRRQKDVGKPQKKRGLKGLLRL